MSNSRSNISRLSTTGAPGVTAGPAGSGSRSIIIPPLPELPPTLTPSDRQKYKEACRDWMSRLQAQFPIPP